MENEGKYWENTKHHHIPQPPDHKISKLIHIHTRIKTLPVSLVSIMCSKDSEETTVPIWIEKEKYYISSLLNSLFNNEYWSER